MKVCPQCDFLNEDCFPTCIWCNAILTEVKSTPHPDPNHPENLEKKLRGEWRAKWRKEIRQAVVTYSLAVTLTAVVPGMVFNPSALAVYFLSALLVAMAIQKGIAGPLIGGIVQGLFTVLLVFGFGPVQPFTFFMIPAHICLAVLLVHWLVLIRDANR